MIVIKEEVLRRYPIGIKFIPIYTHGKPMSYHEEFVSCGKLVLSGIEENKIWWFNKQQGFVYHQGVWVFIIGESKITYNYLIL